MKIKKFIASIMAALLIVLAIPIETNAKETIKTIRLAGSDRYETSIEISKSIYREAKNVVLVSGENFPDALSASHLASYYDAPILLTRKNNLPDEILREIKRLKSEKVFIIGGNQAIHKDIDKVLEKNGVKTERIYGENRVYTNINLIKSISKKSDTICIASSNNFPDALTISALATKYSVPVVLLDKADGINEDHKTLFKKLGAKNFIVAGGKMVISREIRLELSKMGKVIGDENLPDRYATSNYISKIWINKNSDIKHNNINENIILVDGLNFPDALVSSVLAGKKNMSIQLINKDREGYINIGQETKGIYIIGGERAVPSYLTDNLLKKLNRNSEDTNINILPKKDKEGKKDITEEVNTLKDFYDLADYAKSNILISKLSDENNYESKKEEVYKSVGEDINKEKLYFIDLSDHIVLIDLNNKLRGAKKQFIEEEISFKDQVYYLKDKETNDLSILEDDDSKGIKSDIIAILGNCSRSTPLQAKHILGILGNTYSGYVVGLDNSEEIAGVNFVIDRKISHSKGANDSMISISSKAVSFNLNINNNTFKFNGPLDEENTSDTGDLHRAIGIFRMAGNLEINSNVFSGYNKKFGPGSANIHAMIDMRERLSEGDSSSFTKIVNNKFEDVYSAAISLFATDKEGLEISSNIFNNIGEEAIRITPEVLEYPADHNITIEDNNVKNYGLNVNKGYADGNYSQLVDINSGENAIHLSYYGGTQWGAKVNGRWFSSDEKLINFLTAHNTISPAEENNKNEGVVDSIPVKIGQKDLFINTGLRINDSQRIIKIRSLVISKDDNGDVVYGRDPENPTKTIEVDNLYITGEGTGKVTLPSTLHIKGDLKIDLENGNVIIEARVDGKKEINAGRLKNTAKFKMLKDEKLIKHSIENDLQIFIEEVLNDFGEEIKNPKFDFEVFIGKEKLKENQFEYNSGILSIKKDYLNKLNKSENLIISIEDKENKLSKLSSQIFNIEIINLSSGTFEYSRKDFTHFNAEEEIRVKVKNIKNNKGEALSASQTKLEGNVDFLVFGKAQSRSLIRVDDETDTIILSKDLLNVLYATRYTETPDRNQNIGSDVKYTILINDHENGILDLMDELSFNVIDRSGVDFVFENGKTFTQGKAPKDGITISLKNIRNSSGQIVKPSQTSLATDGILNMNVEPFPVQRDDTKDSELLVLRDKDGNFIREIFNPKYLIIDDENDRITFTKDYLDKIIPGKDSSTDRGIKIFVFKYTDPVAGVDVRSSKIALHIKLLDRPLSDNVTISFKENTYFLEKDEILRKDNNPDSLMVSGLLKDIIKNNPRQQVLVIRDGRNLRSFDTIEKNDKLRVIAEDGKTSKEYTIGFEVNKKVNLIVKYPEIVKELGENFILVDTGKSPSIKKLLDGMELVNGARAKIVGTDSMGKEYEPVKDSTIRSDMKLKISYEDKHTYLEIRLRDGLDYRALFIGNQNYGDPKKNLKGPENDLRMMESLFSRMSFSGKRFSKIDIKRDLTKKDFLRSIRETFAGSTDEDTLYFYYSGHGFNIKSTSTSYICTVDEIPENTPEEKTGQYWVSVNELKSEFDKIPGKKVIILDSCNAGGFIGKKFIDASSSPTKKPFNNDENEKFAKNTKEVFEVNNSNNNYLTDTEYKVLVASSENEYSFEDKQKAVGKFTFEFVNGGGINSGNKKADKNKDGRVSLDEMYNYLMETVESVSHIQVFPHLDDFSLIEDVDSRELNSSTNVIIKDNAYKFSKRYDKNKNLLGTISSSLVTINENTKAKDLLANIEKEYDSQTIKLICKNGREYASEEKLRRLDAFLYVRAEKGNESKFPIVVERYISNDPDSSIKIKGNKAKGIEVTIKEKVNLYTIAVKKSLTNGEFLEAIRKSNGDKGQTFKLYTKRNVDISNDLQGKLENLSKLEVISKNKKIRQKYNITVILTPGSGVIKGEYILESGQIRSGSKKITNRTSVQEILNWLNKNGINISPYGPTGIYRNGQKPPFGIKKIGEMKLEKGDVFIRKDFKPGQGEINEEYEIIVEDFQEELTFENISLNFGSKLSVENNTIKGSELKLTNETSLLDIKNAWENYKDIEGLLDMTYSGIYSGGNLYNEGKPSKERKSWENDNLGYEYELILFDKNDIKNKKVFKFILDDKNPGGDIPIIIVPTDN